HPRSRLRGQGTAGRSAGPAGSGGPVDPGSHPRRRVRGRVRPPGVGDGRRRDRGRRLHPRHRRRLPHLRPPGGQDPRSRWVAHRLGRGPCPGGGMKVIPLPRRSALVLTGAAVATLLAFAWPLFTAPSSALAQTDVAPLIFALVLPLVAGVVIVEISGGGLDAKPVAMLGVLSALGAILRPIGAGTGGVELVFFMIVLGGRVFGPGF